MDARGVCATTEPEDMVKSPGWEKTPLLRPWRVRRMGRCHPQFGSAQRVDLIEAQNHFWYGIYIYSIVYIYIYLGRECSAKAEQYMIYLDLDEHS